MGSLKIFLADALRKMAKSSGIIAIIVLLNLFQLHSANAAIESYNQALSYPDKHVFCNNFGSKEENLVYAVCDDNKSELITEYTCSIVQRQFPYDQVTRSCNVTLQMTNPENTNLTDVVIDAFGQENAILFWGEIGSHGKFNLMALKLDSCQTKILQLDDPENSIYKNQTNTHKILTYNNTFDLIVDSTDRPKEWVSNKQTGVRMGFDLESEPLSYDHQVSKKLEEKVQFISPIATRSPDKGFVYTTKHNRGSDVWMVKPDGTPKFLMSAFNGQYFMTSANYGNISACLRGTNDSEAICSQYDDKFTRRIHVEVKFEDKINIMRAHTTLGGGLLLVTRFLDDKKANGYDVLRVNSEGKTAGSIHLIGNTEVPHEMENIEVWENGDKFCATIVNQKTSHGDDLQIDAKCFSENDFTT